MSEADEEPMEKPGDEWIFGRTKMSEPKGSFDALVSCQEALVAAEQFAGSMVPLLGVIKKIGGMEAAIRVLEAAGKVDKEPCINALYDVILLCKKSPSDWTLNRLQAVHTLLEALPDKEEEPKRYRCESCGKDFDKKLFSHSRTEENMQGEPVEVECGPISEVK